MDRILVIEDESVARELVRVQLQAFGLFPVFAENAETALQLLDRETFSLLITDYQLPDITGVRLVERLKLEIPGLPIIVLSAHPDPRVEEAVLAAGADCFIRKPFNVFRFQDRLIALLGRGVQDRKGNSETHKSTITVFLKVFPGYFMELLEFIALKDEVRIRKQIHKMRGALTVCGNDLLTEALNDLRDAVAAGEECGEYAEAFGKLLDEFYDELRIRLEKSGI